MQNIGIWALGTFLPQEVRTNDWWSPEIVASWGAAHADRKRNPVAPPFEGLVFEASKLIADDPFKGARQRHIMDPGSEAVDMEIEAARRAIAAAQIDPNDIDVLLVSAWIPDLIGTNAACTLHEALGLRGDCLALSIDSNFNGFHHQMALFEGLVACGRGHCGLLVQSSSISRVVQFREHYSPWFGDGSTAAIVGPVAPGFGLLASAHRTDGTLQRALHTGIPGKHWFDQEAVRLFSERPERQQQVLARICASSHDVIHAALKEANIELEQVDFYASHQGTWWYRRVTQENAGLMHARSLDTFHLTGSMAACNIPMVLSMALEQQLIADGDIVVTHAGGNGSTWSALVLRWGRA